MFLYEIHCGANCKHSSAIQRISETVFQGMVVLLIEWIARYAGRTSRVLVMMVMAIFAYIYFQSFNVTQVNSVDMIWDHITRNLSFEEQERLYCMLGKLFKEEQSGKS